MSKEMAVIALGAWVVGMPYLGIYRSWLTVLMVLSGVTLMVVGFLLRGEAIAEEEHRAPKTSRHQRRAHVTFEESASVVSHDYSKEDHTSLGSLN